MPNSLRRATNLHRRRSWPIRRTFLLFLNRRPAYCTSFVGLRLNLRSSKLSVKLHRRDLEINGLSSNVRSYLSDSTWGIFFSVRRRIPGWPRSGYIRRKCASKHPYVAFFKRNRTDRCDGAVHIVVECCVRRLAPRFTSTLSGESEADGRPSGGSRGGVVGPLRSFSGPTLNRTVYGAEDPPQTFSSGLTPAALFLPRSARIRSLLISVVKRTPRWNSRPAL